MSLLPCDNFSFCKPKAESELLFVIVFCLVSFHICLSSLYMSPFLHPGITFVTQDDHFVNILYKFKAGSFQKEIKIMQWNKKTTNKFMSIDVSVCILQT